MAHAINPDACTRFAERPGIFARLRQRLADHSAWLALRDELDAMSDRELADIGLSRLNIGDVARTEVYGD